MGEIRHRFLLRHGTDFDEWGSLVPFLFFLLSKKEEKG
jgi:hypothetical protein